MSPLDSARSGARPCQQVTAAIRRCSGLYCLVPNVLEVRAWPGIVGLVADRLDQGGQIAHDRLAIRSLAAGLDLAQQRLPVVARLFVSAAMDVLQRLGDLLARSRRSQLGLFRQASQQRRDALGQRLVEGRRQALDRRRAVGRQPAAQPLPDQAVARVDEVGRGDAIGDAGGLGRVAQAQAQQVFLDREGGARLSRLDAGLLPRRLQLAPADLVEDNPLADAQPATEQVGVMGLRHGVAQLAQHRGDAVDHLALAARLGQVGRRQQRVDHIVDQRSGGVDQAGPGGRITAQQAIRVLAGRQRHNAHVGAQPALEADEVAAERHGRRLVGQRPAHRLDAAQRRHPAGGVGVERQDEPARQRLQQADLRLGQRGPHRGDDVGVAALVGHQRVDVALDQHDLVGPLDRRRGDIDAVEDRALVEDRVLGAVEVLGHGGAQRAPAEAEHAALAVADREDQPGAEAIVDPAAVSLLAQQPGFDGDGVRDLALPQVVVQRLPGVGREAEAEDLDARLVDAALRQQRAAGFAGARLEQDVVEEGRRGRRRVVELLAVGIDERLAGSALGQLDAGPGRQPPQGVRELQPLGLHDEGKGVAALAAAEAVEALRLGEDDEGGRLLLVEGAARLVAAPGPLQRRMAVDQLDDVDALADPLDLGVGRHGSQTPSRRRAPRPAGRRHLSNVGAGCWVLGAGCWVQEPWVRLIAFGRARRSPAQLPAAPQHPAPSTLVAPHPGRRHAHGDAVLGGEALRRHAEAGDRGAVLLQVGRHVGRGRGVRRDGRAAGDDDDVAAGGGAVEVERNVRVALDVA